MFTVNTARCSFAFAVAFCLPLFNVACNVDGAFEPSRAPKGAPVVLNPEAHVSPGGRASKAPVAQQEVDLVEAVLTDRAEYHQSLAGLRDYYRERGYATKLSWAEFELKGLSKVKAFRYVFDSEVASASLRPTDQIAEADGLYQRGLDLMKKGGHGIPIFYRQKIMIQAVDVFKELVEKYPTSDRIDDAAFFLGEIHKEYLPNQEQLAVQWYERAWTWDSATPHPARFQAAVVYDFRLHDRDRALELYRTVLKEETADGGNLRFATRRINKLDEDRGEVTAKMVEQDPRERDAEEP